MPAHYCEADKEYWKERRQHRPPPSATIRRIQTPNGDGSYMWALDGRMTSRGYTDDWLCCPGGFNRWYTGHNRVPGNIALDICSTYGYSSRTFLDGLHNHVVIVEPETLMADMTISNMKNWGFDEEFELWQSRDWDNIDFTQFDSIRFGNADLEMLVHKYSEIIESGGNLIFDMPIGKLTKEILFNAGYDLILRWGSVKIYSINKVTGDNPNE